ncbi:YebC-like protein [Neoconidiobolus thromboides FSU 785]|nr:YebC-like protein [Neoconidiobolus thromboides FSU 785]
MLLQLFRQNKQLITSAEKITLRYAGHSKWANIRHTKGALDKKRGAEFAKIGLELIAAIKSGGVDPQFNLRLAAALALAKSKDFPKKNLENAFKKATGKTEDAMNEVCFFGMGPYSLAVVVEAITASRNRTIKEIRSILTRAGGSITDVAWMFEKKGMFVVYVITNNKTRKIIISSKSESNMDLNTLMEEMLEYDIEDIEEGEEANDYEIICSFDQLGNLSNTINKLDKYTIKSINPYYHPTVEWHPPQTENEDDVVIDEINQFLNQINELDEVIRVHTNLPNK